MEEETVTALRTDDLEYRIIEVTSMTPELDRAIRDCLVASFREQKDKDHFARQRWWHSPHQWTTVAMEPDGTVAGGLCVVERTIMVGGLTHPVAGVGNVCARPRWRKKGVIDRVMATALDEAEKRGFEAGFLFCKPLLEAVYRRMGWTRLDAPVFFEDESGATTPMPETSIAMTIPLGIDSFPDGEVDLMGRDW